MAAAAKFLLKKWWWWLLVFSLWSCGSARARNERGKPRICDQAPPWTALVVNSDGILEEGQQVDPMVEGRGKVMVVALTSAASQHSLEQAQKLGTLEFYFRSSNMLDVSFILVNSAHSKKHIPDLLSQNLSMAVFQENSEDPVWNKLGGKKDFVFVYDRCGRLTFKIPFPMSLIHPGQNVVESSVTSTYLDNICGEQNCSVLKNDSTGNSLLGLAEISNNTEQVEKKTVDETSDEDTGDSSSVDSRLEQLYKSWKEERDRKYVTEAPTTPEPSLFNGLWVLYRKIMKHMPWVSKSNDERDANSVRKYLEQKTEETTAVPELTEKSQEEGCKNTQNSICRAWTKKKLDFARVCCNLHTCNRSTQYLQKHCKNYSEKRCKKVQHILQCCNKTAENDFETDENANTRASASSHPKS